MKKKRMFFLHGLEWLLPATCSLSDADDKKRDIITIIIVIIIDIWHEKSVVLWA